MIGDIAIEPGRFRQFGETEGAAFYLLTNEGFAHRLDLRDDGSYSKLDVVPVPLGQPFDDAVASLPTPAHVLVISPDQFFESPPLEVLGPERKLMAMACNSTPTNAETIAHFVEVMYRTDPQTQEEIARRLFDSLEDSSFVKLVDDDLGVEAVFEHFAQDYTWNQQAGFLDWGEQQIVPSGEISVLPIEIRSFSDDLSLTMNGGLAFHGFPILHSGTPSFTREDQGRLHSGLASMRSRPILAEVENGRVVSLRSAGSASEENPALDILSAMFTVDDRYRIVWELGFAINTSLTMLSGNHAMNEVYGSTDGCLHLGLGLTPYTQYHLDIISPEIRVTNEAGQTIFAGKPS